jgi:hypothetical protein
MGRRLDEAHLAPAQACFIAGQRIEECRHFLATGYQAVQRDETLAIRQAQAPHFSHPTPLSTRSSREVRDVMEVICSASLVSMPRS